MVAKVIENRIVNVTVGTIVENAAGRHEPLLACDWDGAAFRFPHHMQEWRTIHANAVNLEITGRTFQRRNGNHYVKAQLEFVGDGEASTFTEAWVLVNPWTCEYAA